MCKVFYSAILTQLMGIVCAIFHLENVGKAAKAPTKHKGKVNNLLCILHTSVMHSLPTKQNKKENVGLKTKA